MIEDDRDLGRHTYFEETAWSELRLAQKCLAQNRRAKAQEHFINALFYSQKLDSEFTNREFSNDLAKLNNILYRGY